MSALFGISGIVFADQAAKLIAVQTLTGHPTVPVIPGVFHLTLVRNTGVAFGWLAEVPFAVTLLSGMILGILLFFFSRDLRSRRSQAFLPMVLIVGGAVGNLIDRIRLGVVIDFLDFRIWPVFNLADSCISIGAGLLLLAMLRTGSQGSSRASDPV